MKSDIPKVRRLVETDLSRCVELSMEAGWNQTVADWQFLVEHGHGYGIEIPDRGLVATTVEWDLGERHAWISMVLVTEPCRSRGYARRLLDVCLRDAEAGGRAVLLDATDMGAKVYGKLGFAGEDRLVRMRRPGAGNMPTTSEASPGQGAVAPMMVEDLAVAAKLDRAVLGAERREFVADLLGRSAGTGWMWRGTAGVVEGFLLGRAGRTAWHLGPLVAPNEMAACQLVAHALARKPGPVIIDVPEAQESWVSVLAQWDFEPERRFRRMGRGGAKLTTDWSRYFAMAGPDFA